MSENDGHDIGWPGAQPSGTNGPAQSPNQPGGNPPVPDDDATRSLDIEQTVAFDPDAQQTVAFDPGATPTAPTGQTPGRAWPSAGEDVPQTEQTLFDVTGQGPTPPPQWPQPDQASMWQGQAGTATPPGQQNPYQAGWAAGQQPAQDSYPYQPQGPYQGQDGYQQPGQPQSGYPQPPYGQPYQQDQSGYYGQPQQRWSDPRAEHIAGHTSWDANGQFIPYQQPNPQAQGFYDQLGQWVPYQQPQQPKSRSKKVAGITAAIIIGLGGLSLGIVEASNALNIANLTIGTRRTISSIGQA